MSDGEEHRGGCLCGEIRYAIGTPVSPGALCHCVSCRRASGAPAVAWVTVREEAFRLEKGTPQEYRSSPQVRRGFCSRCGTPLSYRHEAHPGFVDVTVASLDEPAALPPADHIWTEHRITWMEHLDDLPEYPRTRIS